MWKLKDISCIHIMCVWICMDTICPQLLKLYLVSIFFKTFTIGFSQLLRLYLCVHGDIFISTVLGSL